MNPLPLPSKWIPWAVGLAVGVCLLFAIHCPAPSPDTHALTVAHDSTVHAVAHMDSIRRDVKIAHAQSNLRVKTLAPLRARVELTPNAVLVDGRDTLSGPGAGVIAKVIAAQDSTIAALERTVAVQDSALIADSLALQASLHETAVARSLIPSKWQRVKTAARWGVVGGVVVKVAEVAVKLLVK